MTNKRLGQITQIMAQNRLRGVKLVGKSAFEKELAAWINEPEIKIENPDENKNKINPLFI